MFLTSVHTWILAFSQFIWYELEFMNMAWNISEIMENENVPGCNLNIEQLETGSSQKRNKNKYCMHRNIQIWFLKTTIDSRLLKISSQESNHHWQMFVCYKKIILVHLIWALEHFTFYWNIESVETPDAGSEIGNL